MTAPLRLMIYDDTCRGARASLGLTHSWIAGAWLYQKLDRLDACRGVRSFAEALSWLAEVQPHRPLAEVQFWGHGKWGRACLHRDVLDADSLAPGHPHAGALRKIAQRLTPDALWWFRTCETFGARSGQSFARRFAETLGCQVAGHTFIIGPWQSGLHTLRPGASPTWEPDEGLAEGSPDAPIRALWSSPRRPHTIHCLQGRIPAGY